MPGAEPKASSGAHLSEQPPAEESHLQTIVTVLWPIACKEPCILLPVLVTLALLAYALLRLAWSRAWVATLLIGWTWRWGVPTLGLPTLLRRRAQGFIARSLSTFGSYERLLVTGLWSGDLVVVVHDFNLQSEGMSRFLLLWGWVTTANSALCCERLNVSELRLCVSLRRLAGLQPGTPLEFSIGNIEASFRTCTLPEDGAELCEQARRQEAELQRELDEVRAWELFYSWAFWQQQRERARPRGACHPSIARTTLLLLVCVCVSSPRPGRGVTCARTLCHAALRRA